MSFALSDPTIVIDNEPVSIVPGTFKFTEGKGEFKVRPKSSGNGNVTNVISQDVMTKISNFSFELYNDIDGIELSRGWKERPGLLGVRVTARDPQDGREFTRTFNNSTSTMDPEIEFSAESTFTVEFQSEPSV